jgi:hypothetical protein
MQVTNQFFRDRKTIKTEKIYGENMVIDTKACLVIFLQKSDRFSKIISIRKKEASVHLPMIKQNFCFYQKNWIL